jgi:RND family efflux transporter MFP subunit
MTKKGWIGLGVGLAVTIGIAAAVAAAVARKGDDGAKKIHATLEFQPREIVALKSTTMPTRIDFSGPLVAPSTAVLRARTSGTLVSLAVAEGSRVSAGQLVGRIDPAEMASRVAEREAMLESARAALVQAQRNHASNQRLADQQFISGSALDASRLALDSAQAQLRAAQASLDTARLVSRETALVAPIAGVVGKRHVLPGEKVGMDQQILTIVDLRRLELAASVGTHEVSLLQAGMPVTVRIEGHDGDVTGRIARVAPAAEPGTRSIGIAVEVANPKEVLRAGQYATGRVVLPDAQARPTLPIGAVAGGAGQEHVWVIEQGALVRRAVTTGRRDESNGRVEVLSGIDERAQVLAARFDNLREGAKAVIVAPSAPVASASSATIAR